MPRRITSKRTIIVRKPKVKWSPHVETVNYQVTMGSGTNFTFYPHVIAANASDSHLPSVPVVQVTRINFQGQLGTAGTANLDWFAYIMYIPEGMDAGLATVDNWIAFINQHPEYIMARRIVDPGDVSNNTTATISLQTRMRRNLNSGDQVVLLLIAHSLTAPSTARNLDIYGQLSYYTKVN